MRSRLLALLLPALCLPLACEDSSSSSGAPFSLDAGPGFDAGTTPSPEAGMDAFVPPMAEGITVTVLDGTKPSSDVRVLFHDAAGAVIGDQKTDAAGRVTAATAPSMVTVLSRDVNGAGALGSPITYLGVADGDKLVVVIPSSPAAAPVVGKYSVTLQPFDGVTSFGVSVMGNSCAAFTSNLAEPLLVNLFEPCLATQNAVLAVGNDATNALLGFGFTKTAARPAANATVSLSLGLTAPTTSTKITVANPGSVTGTNATLHAIANGASFRLGFESGSLSEGGLSFPTPSGFADAYQASARQRSPSAAGSSEQFLVRREPATANGTLAFDFANALPALTINDTALVQTTPGRPDITVGSTAPLTAADGGVVKISWSVSFTTVSWAFVVPPSVTSFKAPALPADAVAFAPTAGARIQNVTYFEASQLPGYKEVKALPVSTSYFAIDLLEKPLSATAALRVSRFSAGE